MQHRWETGPCDRALRAAIPPVANEIPLLSSFPYLLDGAERVPRRPLTGDVRWPRRSRIKRTSRG